MYLKVWCFWNWSHFSIGEYGVIAAFPITAKVKPWWTHQDLIRLDFLSSQTAGMWSTDKSNLDSLWVNIISKKMLELLVHTFKALKISDNTLVPTELGTSGCFFFVILVTSGILLMEKVKGGVEVLDTFQNSLPCPLFSLWEPQLLWSFLTQI